MPRPALVRITTILLALGLPIAIVAAVAKDDDVRTRTVDDAAGQEQGSGNLAAALARAADGTAAVDHFRYEMTMAMDGGPFDLGPVVTGTGEQAGPAAHFLTDPGAFAREIAGDALPDDLFDLSVETYSDGATTYIRAPGVGAMADDLPAGALPPGFDTFLTLGDGWGVIDQTRVSVFDVAGQFGGSGMDVAYALDLLRRVAGEVEPNGKGDVHGTPVDLYEGTITFGELSESSGFGDGFLDDVMGDVMGDLDTDAVLDALASAELPVAIGIDDEGLVRRVAFTMDLGAIFESGDAPELSVTTGIDLYDVGDPSITIDMPAVDDPVDLTPWALELLGAQTD